MNIKQIEENSYGLKKINSFSNVNIFKGSAIISFFMDIVMKLNYFLKKLF
jgi:hypothetical protein